MKNTIKNKFIELFGTQPDMQVSSPGRINLIGEHVDYNGGWVLPAAIDKKIVFAIGKRKNLTEYKAVLERVTGNLEVDENSYPEYYRYYTAQALFQGDFESWNKWNLMTARQLKDLQGDDGSFQSGHGTAYGTSMSLLAMALNYRFLPIYER